MKKLIIISLFLFPFFSHASFSRDLYYGVRGDAEVQALQEFLADQGHYTGAASGNFFSLTLSAVKKFQIANNISPVSGYFGPKTRAKANQILEGAGVSADSVKNEDNAPVSASVALPKTANDVVASLANQIALLQQQLATLQKNQDALQQQNQSLQTIQQQQAAQTQQIAQQTQTLQQIQQNTTPAPYVPPSPPQPPPEVDKSEIVVKVNPVTVGNVPTFVSLYGIKREEHSFRVRVLDNKGKQINTQIVMSMPPDDQNALQGGVCGGVSGNHDSLLAYSDFVDGRWINCKLMTNEPDFTIGTTQVNSVIIPDTWSKPFYYTPTTLGTKTITFTSGNLSKTITFDVSQ